MKEIPLTQDKVAIVDDEDYEYLRQTIFRTRKQGKTFYAQSSVYIEGKQKTQQMHRLIMDAPEGMEIDHINGNGLDNRKENLRVCSRGENARNRGKQKNNSIGYKGVHITKEGYIRAQIQVSLRKIYIGYYKTPELAAQAYNEAAIKYHGEFAQLNEI